MEREWDLSKNQGIVYEFKEEERVQLIKRLGYATAFIFEGAYVRHGGKWLEVTEEQVEQARTEMEADLAQQARQGVLKRNI